MKFTNKNLQISYSDYKNKLYNTNEDTHTR
jgi:hypothetical protein